MTKDLPKVVIPFSTDYYFVKGGLPLVQSEDGTISVISHFRTESGQEVEIYHSRRVVVIKLSIPIPYKKAVEINERHRNDLRVDGYA